MPVVIEILSLVFFLLIAGMVWLVVHLNKKRSGGDSQVVWSQVAQHYGGQFTPGGSGFQGHRIVVQRPFTQLVLEVALMSKVQCMGSPYHRAMHQKHGGTFTHARATFPRGNGPSFSGTRDEAAQTPMFQGLPLQQLPQGAMVYLTPNEGIIVMNGHVADPNVLYAAANIVGSLAERASA